MTVFFGTSKYSAYFLESVLKKGLKISLVVSAPPKPVGRRQVLTENPTVIAANKLRIPFITDLKELTRYQNKTTIGLMLDFNRIVPKEVIEHFPKGIINIHFSKLPKYRGPAPIQFTILNNESEAWITYFLINERLDEGPILAQTSVLLDENETTESLYQKLIVKASQEIVKIIADYLESKIKPSPQSGQPSYTHKLSADNAKIDWSESLEKIDRLIRAAYPEPGAWTEILVNREPLNVNRRRLKILKAHLKNDQLILDTVQLEGKKPVSWKQFREGHPKTEIAKNSRQPQNDYVTKKDFV